MRSVPASATTASMPSCSLRMHPPKKYGGALVFLDLTTGEVQWKKKSETGWSESYWFDDMERKLGLEL